MKTRKISGKRLLAACLLGSIMAWGIGYVNPQLACAYPSVNIGHGHGSYTWYVDVGSIKSTGSETTVMVSLDNEHDSYGSRRYHFKFYDNSWHYKYDSWTGKGDYTPGYSWGLVADSQMANDVLYVVNQ